jgi:putative acetyltransferase
VSIVIREALEEDLDAVLDVERRAFGQDIEAELVRALMSDPSAVPRLSLLAATDGQPIGHVLFTAVTVTGADRSVRASILAPLAVVPEVQSRGYGKKLVEHGLTRLARDGAAIVFVLGDPRYYSRFGFTPATRLAFEPPFELPAEYRDAWMVKALGDGIIGSVTGRIRCADALSRPEYWRD